LRYECTSSMDPVQFGPCTSPASACVKLLNQALLKHRNVRIHLSAILAKYLLLKDCEVTQKQYLCEANYWSPLLPKESSQGLQASRSGHWGKDTPPMVDCDGCTTAEPKKQVRREASSRWRRVYSFGGLPLP